MMGVRGGVLSAIPVLDGMGGRIQNAVLLRGMNDLAVDGGAEQPLAQAHGLAALAGRDEDPQLANLLAVDAMFLDAHVGSPSGKAVRPVLCAPTR